MWIKLRFVFQMSLVFPERKTILTGNPRGQEVVTVEKSAILSEFGLDPKENGGFIWRKSWRLEN